MQVHQEGVRVTIFIIIYILLCVVCCASRNCVVYATESGILGSAQQRIARAVIARARE